MCKTIFLFFLILVQGFAQWENKHNNLPQWYTQGWAIDAIDSLNAVIAIIPGQYYATLYKTENGGLVWDSLNFNRWVTDISMIDKMHIWVCTADPNEIYNTEDGGKTWSVQYQSPDTVTAFFNYIEMFGLNDGVVMGDAPYPAINKPVAILKTTNGGSNWDLIDNNFRNAFSSLWYNIDFLNPNVGFFKPSYDNSCLLYTSRCV